MMGLKVGDYVEYRKIPDWVSELPNDRQQVYEECLGGRFTVSAIEVGDYCVLELGQAWDHFSDLGPFNFRVKFDCVRVVVPFSEAELEKISEWSDADQPLMGSIGRFEDGWLKVLLGMGISANLPVDSLPDGADPTSLLGSQMEVKIIHINPQSRELTVYPYSHFKNS